MRRGAEDEDEDEDDDEDDDEAAVLEARDTMGKGAQRRYSRATICSSEPADGSSNVSSFLVARGH